MKTYAAYYYNDEIRLKSSSGGLFSAIASKFDVIYGVTMTGDCHKATFTRVEKDISKLRGSKYIQAKVGDTFQQVRNDVIAGKKVLFTGTGCQINGLSLFLGKEYNNLFLLDIVCHGVPSPGFWEKYIEYQEKKYGEISSVNFRCKQNSWNDFGIKENQVFIPKEDDAFMRIFLKDYCLRPSCYECHAKDYKLSDMTIADFWGIETIAPEMSDNKGTSLVIIRSEKGQQLFENIKNQLIWKEVQYEEGVRCNTAEYQSTLRPIERDSFFIDLNRMDFRKFLNKYSYGPLWKRIGRKVKQLLRKSRGVEGNTSYGVLLTLKKYEN